MKNNKNDTVQLRLKDQCPLSANKDIEIELLESTAAVNNTALGILTWKLQLAPGNTKKAG